MSLLATRLLNVRANSDTDKWEIRPSQYGVLDLAMRETEDPNSIVSSELKAKAIAAVGNTVEVPVINYDNAVTIGSSRTVTIADDENTSALMPITFATYTFGFTQTPALFMNNELGQQRDFEAKLKKYIFALGTALETAGLAVLDGVRAQALNDTLGKYTFPAANQVEIPLANRDEAVGDLNVLLNGNDIFDMEYSVVGNNSLNSLVRNRLLEKGQFNTEDKTYQWQDKTFGFSNVIGNEALFTARGYVMPKGSFGMIVRHEADSLRGSESASGHKWDIDTLPYLDLPISTYYYEGSVDANTLAGAASAHLTRAYKQYYGFSIDVAFVPPYVSDHANNPSPVLKFAVATT